MNPRGLALRPQRQQQIHLCTRQTIRVPSSATRPRGPTNHQLGKKAAYARAPEARGLALRHQPRQQTTSPYTRGLAASPSSTSPSSTPPPTLEGWRFVNDKFIAALDTRLECLYRLGTVDSPSPV